MNRVAEQYARNASAIKLHKRQDELVGDYLLEHGEVENDFLYNTGLPGCGRIKNPRQRIHELRAANWDIKTDTERIPGKCFYILVAAPGQQKRLL